MNDFQREVFDKAQQLDQYSENKDSVKLAETLVDILDIIQRLKQESIAKKVTIDENARLNIVQLKLK